MSKRVHIGLPLVSVALWCSPIACNDASDGSSLDNLQEDADEARRPKKDSGAQSGDAGTEAGSDSGSADSGTSPWSVPFLGRTASAPIHLTNCSNVTISGKQFVNVNDDAIVIEGCNNVTITENDFSNVVGAIYLLNSTNVTISWNRYQNVGNGTIGSGHSNFVQFNKTYGGIVSHNKGISGNTEDIVSVYQSGGPDDAHPLIIEYNAFEGTNWTSGSGSGMMLGDAGGAHIIARYNTLLSPGQVGFGVPGGTDIHITDNVVYGAQRTSSNVGIYVWNQSSGACSGVEVARNKVKWFRADGVENPYWNAGNCGAVSGDTTNDWHATIDPNALHVVL